MTSYDSKNLITSEDVINHIMGTMKISKGMAKGMLNSSSTYYSCPSCGFPIPVYPGKYPSKCPNCSKDICKDTLELDSTPASVGIFQQPTLSKADILQEKVNNLL